MQSCKRARQSPVNTPDADVLHDALQPALERIARPTHALLCQTQAMDQQWQPLPLPWSRYPQRHVLQPAARSADWFKQLYSGYASQRTPLLVAAGNDTEPSAHCLATLAHEAAELSAHALPTCIMREAGTGHAPPRGVSMWLFMPAATPVCQLCRRQEVVLSMFLDAYTHAASFKRQDEAPLAHDVRCSVTTGDANMTHVLHIWDCQLLRAADASTAFCSCVLGICWFTEYGRRESVASWLSTDNSDEAAVICNIQTMLADARRLGAPLPACQLARLPTSPENAWLLYNENVSSSFAAQLQDADVVRHSVACGASATPGMVATGAWVRLTPALRHGAVSSRADKLRDSTSGIVMCPTPQKERALQLMLQMARARSDAGLLLEPSSMDEELVGLHVAFLAYTLKHLTVNVSLFPGVSTHTPGSWICGPGSPIQQRQRLFVPLDKELLHVYDVQLVHRTSQAPALAEWYLASQQHHVALREFASVVTVINTADTNAAQTAAIENENRVVLLPLDVDPDKDPIVLSSRIAADESLGPAAAAARRLLRQEHQSIRLALSLGQDAVRPGYVQLGSIAAELTRTGAPVQLRKFVECCAARLGTNMYLADAFELATKLVDQCTHSPPAIVHEIDRLKRLANTAVHLRQLQQPTVADARPAARQLVRTADLLQSLRLKLPSDKPVHIHTDAHGVCELLDRTFAAACNAGAPEPLAAMLRVEHAVDALHDNGVDCLPQPANVLTQLLRRLCTCTSRLLAAYPRPVDVYVAVTRHVYDDADNAWCLLTHGVYCMHANGTHTAVSEADLPVHAKIAAAVPPFVLLVLCGDGTNACVSCAVPHDDVM